MKSKFIYIFLLFTLVSCDLFFKEKPDSDLFSDIEPIVWSDDYVISATNYPSSILIWDTKTNSLVKSISLNKSGRALTILEMAVLDKSVWLIALGMSTNLIRIDFESGRFEFIDFSYDGYKSRPYSLKAIEESNTLWVKSYGNLENGTLFACYNSNGTLNKSFVINEAIRSGAPMNVFYLNNQHIMIGAVENKINVKNNSIFGYMINLDNKKSKAIYYNDIFEDNFFNSIGYENIDYFLSNSWKVGKNSLTILLYNSDLQEKLIEQALFDINLLNQPLNCTFSKVHLHDKYIEEIFEDNEKKTIIYYNSGREDDFRGLEIAFFEKQTGVQTKKIDIPNANRLFIHQKNNASWISMNSYEYIGNNKLNKKEEPKICKLDHNTKKVYVYSKDGTYKELTCNE